MAARGRPNPNAGVGPAHTPYGPGVHHPSAWDHKLAIQHAEIQRLLSDNQRLATLHVALRQELAAAQQELQRLQQSLAGLQSEKDQQLRGLAEKAAKMEADLLATEPLKIELQKIQADAQKFSLVQQELTTQVQQLSQDLLRARVEAQQLPAMKSDIEALGQEVQRARTAFEYEKKAKADILEQRQVMEKNMVTLAREVERLRAELVNPEKKTRVGGYGAAFGGSDSAYPIASGYGDNYGIPKMGAATEGNVPLGAGAAASTRGRYDIQRAGGSYGRRRVSQDLQV